MMVWYVRQHAIQISNRIHITNIDGWNWGHNVGFAVNGFVRKRWTKIVLALARVFMDYGLVIVIHTIYAQELRFKVQEVICVWCFPIWLCSVLFKFQAKSIDGVVGNYYLSSLPSLFDQEYFLLAMCENLWYNRIYILCIVMRQFDFALIREL